MNKFLGIIGFFVGISCTSLAQESKKFPALHLYNYPGSVANISWDGKKYFEPEETRLSKHPQQLIKNAKGLYAVLIGSGLLYKASVEDGRLVFNRVDSTVYFGDNFDSFNFSYRDTIYSFGGYGFWETNGLLRYYIEVRHEWDIIKLNRKLPFKTGNTYDLIWYDQANGKLYFGFTTEENSNTTEKESESNIHFETMVLDMKHKVWQQLGTLSPYLKNDLNSIKNIISSPFGQMIAFRNKNLFLDYANNKIYRFSDMKQREIEQLPTSTGDAHVNYFIGSTFYSWLTEKGLVDSMKITRGDLVLMNEEIYTPALTPGRMNDKKLSSSPLPVILTIAGLVAAISIGYYFGRRNSRLTEFPKGQEKNNTTTGSGNDFVIPLSQLEIDVLQVVFENSSKGAYTSMEEINKALGVSKKNSDIQKKQRSDIISSINKKYFYIKQSKQELIEKNRTEFDKRSFEYFIDSSRLTDASAFIKSVDSSIQL